MIDAPLPTPAIITQMLTQTAPKHLSTEATYRFYERLGIMAGNKPATPEQLQAALLEANEYDLNSDDSSHDT
jgi:hypothetical protein